jgi:hypothetical protein
MPKTPKIFLETNALKFASERVLRWYSKPGMVRWGDSHLAVRLVRCYEEYPNEQRGLRDHWRLRLDALMLRHIAWLALEHRVELLSTREVETELHTLPKTDDPRGLFYGAPITWVRAPAWQQSAEWLLDPTGRRRRTPFQRLLEFLPEIQRQRFLELQKAAGAYQGERRPLHPNQLLDAFHIWCAESAGADYFLTLDSKLLRHLAGHRRYPPRVACVRPMGLLRALEKAKTYFTWDGIRYFPYALRQELHPQTDHPMESLVRLTQHLDRRDRPSMWRRWFRRRAW